MTSLASMVIIAIGVLIFIYIHRDGLKEAIDGGYTGSGEHLYKIVWTTIALLLIAIGVWLLGPITAAGADGNTGLFCPNRCKIKEAKCYDTTYNGNVPDTHLLKPYI